jgi:hypothetical protein
MKKKIIFALIIFVGALFLTGCTLKAKTGDEFAALAEKYGMTVKDYTSSYSYLKYVTEVRIATHPDGWKVEYYTLSDQTNTDKIYDTNKNKFISEVEKSGTSKYESTLTTDNGERYSVQGSDGYYMHVCKIDNTFVYAKISAKNKDAAVKFLKELGY